MSERFENIGKVIKVYGGGKVDILVQQLSACASCHASCSMAGEKAEKIFTVNTNLDLKEGDTVKVSIDNSNVKKSAVISYLIPTVILVFLATILQYLGIKDIFIAFSSLGILVLYFLILKFILKNKNVNIAVEKIN
ncbi:MULTISPECIES: SoxR reducing system RseC family protein [Calditerrivibrio]|uniref:Positive regulator of sigma E, RseC/MucC n=1 Tax=Calditerrivibrio nitroreducens TaxID=477976 RepID=A0A2J6WIN3_9BACT|nr:MAG: hypothetical protein C0187_05740 [Calditerrivibrio nitroreducens]